MRLRAAFALMVLTVAGLSVAPARAADGNCDVSGVAGEYQVRKITIPQGPARRFHLHSGLTRPFTLTTQDDNWHMFSGLWIIDAYNGGTNSYEFFDYTMTFGPPSIDISVEGQGVIRQGVPSTDVLESGVQGRYKINPSLIPGTYYIVGFGNGYGTWHGELDIAGATSADCPLINVAGKVVGFDASDFTGGTQARAPGYGTATGAKLSFTNPYRYILGGLYFYEPAPFPAAKLDWQTELGSGAFTNTIYNMTGPSPHNFTFTGSYTGKTNTVLIQILELDLDSSTW